QLRPPSPAAPSPAPAPSGSGRAPWDHATAPTAPRSRWAVPRRSHQAPFSMVWDPQPHLVVCLGGDLNPAVGVGEDDPEVAEAGQYRHHRATVATHRPRAFD